MDGGMGESLLSLTIDLVEAYASVFVHCWSQYAVQQRDGSYWRVREPLTLPLLLAHLAGRCTLGTYLLDEHHQCSFAVFDADRRDGLEQLVGLAMELALSGIPTLLEASRRGGHLWVHLAEPTSARAVRAWLLPAAHLLGVEFYPKQDALGPDGACSLIRLPLGTIPLKYLNFVQNSGSVLLPERDLPKEDSQTYGIIRKVKDEA